MESILMIPIILGFIVTLFFIPLWIRKSRQIDLVWEDMNKPSRNRVTGSGGVIVSMAFVLGVLVYIALKTFVLKTNLVTVEIFAILSTIIIALLIGFIDDIFGWVKGGLSRRFRIILLLFAAIPLMVINAGVSEMMGIELGLFYPLFFIPIGVVGAAVTFNFLAGYNGLEASQGIILLSGMTIVTIFVGDTWLSLILLIMIACLLAFFIFNKYPAKIFPGDSLTYPVGALIATAAILGNIEKVAIFFFIPYILEFGLKMRGGLLKQSFAKVNTDGSLERPYEKYYGLEHIAIDIVKKFKNDGKVYEKNVVYLINAFQILIIVLGFVLFWGGLFNA